MKHKFIAALLAAICLGAKLQAGVIEDWFNYVWYGERPVPPNIKVLIVHDQPGVVLEVKGKYKIFDPNNNAHITTRFIGKRKFVQALHDSIKWGEEFPGLHQIKIVPDDPKTTTLVDGVEYKGDIYVYDIGGTISVVNEVNIEEYLKSVLLPQFDSGLPEEELAAIVIAARTNANYQAKNSKNTFWAVEASKVGYDGQVPNHNDTALKKAINDTRYMIMEKDGAAFPAQWGSTTGGKMNKEKATFSRISLFEAEEMAKKGDNAAQILGKAFPGSAIKLNFTP